MANMSVYPNADAFTELWNVDFGGYATDTLNKCSPILEKALKNKAKDSVMHEGDSEMVNSIKASSPKKAKNGAYIVNVGPRGYSKTKTYKAKKTGRKYPVSNALKAIWKEYGIPGYRSANPFIQPAVNSVENEILDIIQKNFEEKLKI